MEEGSAYYASIELLQILIQTGQAQLIYCMETRLRQTKGIEWNSELSETLVLLVLVSDINNNSMAD